MPTKVYQVELTEPIRGAEGLDHYDTVLVFLRYCGRAVGQFRLPVVEGRVGADHIREMVTQMDRWPLWTRVVQDFLEWEAEESPPYRPAATAAVITRDRPEDLRTCLDALIRMPDDGQEILVVDSCPSTEASRELVESFGPRVRYVREERPGESVARNRVLREARHRIVAFTDDDAAPDPGWLRALVRNFRDPRVACVTGLVSPMELETPAQEAFEQHSPHGRGFVRRVFSQENHYALHVSPVGVSANVAVRRDLPEQIGWFDKTMGVGTPTRCAMDYEFFVRVLTAGYLIVYDPAALSWHRHRRTWSELRQTIYGYGVGVYALLTRLFFVGREPSAPLIAWRWLSHRQLPGIVRSVLRRPDSTPMDLLVAELLGCFRGPWAYLASRRRLLREPRA